jgi:putative transposase
MNSAMAIAPHIGIAAACLGLGVARATFYRAQRPVSARQPRAPRPTSPRALSVTEQHAILEWLHQPAYVDLSPRTVFAMLLDAGRYLASVSTFYRLLRTTGETRGLRGWARRSFIGYADDFVCALQYLEDAEAFYPYRRRHRRARLQ